MSKVSQRWLIHMTAVAFLNSGTFLAFLQLVIRLQHLPSNLIIQWTEVS